MKNKNLFTVILCTLAAMIMTVSSCDSLGSLLGGVTAGKRVQNFISDVEGGNYDDLYTHFYEGMTDSYSNIKSAEYWDNTPFAAAYNPQITNVGEPEESGNTTYISAVLESGTDYNITFELMAEGDTYYIVEIDFESADEYDVRVLALE